MIFPQYQSTSVVNLVSTILKYYGVPNVYPPIPDLTLPPHDRLVYMVIDALGYNFLCKYGLHSFLYQSLSPISQPTNEMTFLQKEWEKNSDQEPYKTNYLTSVFPSTTASALTALVTGLAPLQHALTGWYMYYRELGMAGIPLPFLPRCGKKSFTDLGINIHDLNDFKTIFHLINQSMTVIIPKTIAGSPFANYCYGDRPQKGFTSIEEYFSLIKNELTHTSTQIIYAYTPQYDFLCHEYGVDSLQVLDFFKIIDCLFHDLIEYKDEKTLVILTADHGMINTSEEATLNMDDYPDLKSCLILPLCGEPRMPYCYVRPSKLDLFRRIIDQRFAQYCQRYSLEEFLRLNAFGLYHQSPRFWGRVGDEILVMKENYIFRDYLYPEMRKKLIGCHGGVSADEMFVPLIIR